jgi:peptidoglycan/xylan/chitin deacetylase (PgdA/CDA1 family)
LVQRQGIFVVSLDFELGWGVQDINRGGNYDQNILAVYDVVPRLLQLFEQHDIHATWATVGALFAGSMSEIKAYIPMDRPSYKKKQYAPYELIDNKLIYEQDVRYFGKSLIQQVLDTPHQEIGTHTFSHYYCLEDGQTSNQFKQDIEAALAIADRTYTSIIFPRNQANKDYLDICKSLGITAYRGNARHLLYAPQCHEAGWKWRRVLQIADTYWNLTGHQTFPINEIKKNPIWNIPASAFMRPYHRKLHLLERLRIRRIKEAMTYAAKNKEVYHLWWHPHNLGKHVFRNFKALEEIFEHYDELHKTYGFKSKNMQEIVDEMEKKERG